MAYIPMKHRWLDLLKWFGVDPHAPDEHKFHQTLLIGTAMAVMLVAPFWGGHVRAVR